MALAVKGLRLFLMYAEQASSFSVSFVWWPVRWWLIFGDFELLFLSCHLLSPQMISLLVLINVSSVNNIGRNHGCYFGMQSTIDMQFTIHCDLQVEMLYFSFLSQQGKHLSKIIGIP